MKTVYVEIAGECGTGKTTIAHALKNVLKSHGMSVTVLDDEFNDDAVTPEKIDRNLSAIGHKGSVIIRSRQLSRKCY